MKLQTVLIVALLCVGAGLLAGLALASQDPCKVTPADAAPVGAGAPGPELEGPELEGTTTELERAQRDLAAERTRREAAEAELAAARGEGIEPSKPATAEASDGEQGARDPRAPRFVYDGLEVALAKSDWVEVGEAVTKLQPLIEELRHALSHGEEPTNVAQIQRWNSTLLGMAMQSKQAGVPGTGVNGVFSHPVVMVNMIYATLRSAGTPLDEVQAERMGALGDKYLREDRVRESGYNEDALLIEKLIAESALKDRFFADVDRLLTEAQRDVLHSESVRGRLGIDLFSSGMLWNPLVRPTEFTTREDLGAALADTLQRRYSFGAEFASVLADTTAEWARGFSDHYLDETDDSLAGVTVPRRLPGWLRVDQARVAAEHQLVLFRALIERLPPDSPIVEKLRGAHRIAVPVKRPAK